MAIDRRSFTKGVAATAAGFAVPMMVSSRVLGANDRLVAGVIGLGGRGAGAHLSGLQDQQGVTVAAVCDADEQRAAKAAERVHSRYGHRPEQYTDMRQLLDRSDIDVVSNATQNYWHALSTIWACQAGKHVYIEKPLSHYIWEGRQMVRAARHHDRIVQCGTQRRSQQSIIDGIAWIHEGHLGAIRYITAFANKPRASCGRRETPLPIPGSVDYDLWCGPAKKLPIFRDRLHYDCSFDWNTGDGESCNQGVHEMDIARWCLGEPGLPRRVMSIGGRFLFDDACDVPNTQMIYYDFATAPVLYEAHNLPRSATQSVPPTFRGERVGVIVECEGGSVSLYRGIAWDHHGRAIRTFSGGGDHFVNFIDAVRSGDRGRLRAEVEVGHLSTAVCHTGNIAYRVGHVASEKQQQAVVAEIPLLHQQYERFVSHLEANQIDVNTATLGPWLSIDQQNERFHDHELANQLARGWYREPYTVPEVA
jgi:predicted dehydrogenase